MRNKPKKADLVFKGKRYWFSDYERNEAWDNEKGEYDRWGTYTVHYYDTDEEIDEDDYCDDDLNELIYIRGEKIFPRIYGDYLSEL